MGSLTPQMRLRFDQSAVKQLMAASVPDAVSNTAAKDVWDALMKLIDLARRGVKRHVAQKKTTYAVTLVSSREQLATMGKSVPDAEYAAILSLPPPSDRPTSSAITAPMPLPPG